ncbi:cytochrome P450 94A1-like [Impatiens glandulifera]|uniref:cytochrome P450 94A1-like n=1 Tax=Impatiens glandulifera TaxID=253017 RepID=UPI001FB0D31A|nr:cytochrome P450 94A1-like [Impatiens glandulifera]
MQQISLSYLTLSLLVLILSLLLHHLFRFSNKSITPCPQSYPLIGNLIGFIRNRHRFHDWVTELLASSSPDSLLTIQVNGVLGLSHGICTADPANLDHLLRLNFQNYVKGFRFRSVLDELLGDGIFNVDGDLWSSQRKIASHEFNTKSLKYFVANSVTSQISSRLIPRLTAASSDGEAVDLQELFRRFGFDNICQVAFGIDPKSSDPTSNQKVSIHSSFIKAFDSAIEISSNRFMSPVPAIWKIKRLLNIGSERTYKDCISIINSYCMSLIESREKDMEIRIREDLLSRFMMLSDLGFRDREEKRKFMRDITVSFILAGKDSTSTALTWFFWLIAGHPRCEKSIHDELISTKTMTISSKFDYDDLKKLHYLHAAISESLRLFPPIPINSKLAVSDDILPDGTRVGKGWFADYSAYAMGRMESLWGSDCREFKPERWLDVDGHFKACDQFKFPVFHCGPRMCLGKEMAYVQMKSIVAAVMQDFEVEAMDGGGCAEKMREPPYTLSLLLKMKDGFPVRLKRRK